MGLDMYLNKKTYIAAKYEHREVTGSVDIFVKGKRLNIDFKKLSYIEEEVGYWRKANHIHRWFVTNVQDGEDNCETYEVSTDHLKELAELCKQANEYVKSCPKKTITVHTGWANGQKTFENQEVYDVDETKITLPSLAGFFFGSTEYDEWYIKDNENTIEIIESLDPDPGYEVTYTYNSSW